MSNFLRIGPPSKCQIYWQILIGEVNLPREPANVNDHTEDLAMRLQYEFADHKSIRFGLLVVLRFTVEHNAQAY